VRQCNSRFTEKQSCHDHKLSRQLLVVGQFGEFARGSDAIKARPDGVAFPPVEHKNPLSADWTELLGQFGFAHLVTSLVKFRFGKLGWIIFHAWHYSTSNAGGLATESCICHRIGYRCAVTACDHITVQPAPAVLDRDARSAAEAMRLADEERRSNDFLAALLARRPVEAQEMVRVL
jgi:hypothetical protein